MNKGINNENIKRIQKDYAMSFKFGVKQGNKLNDKIVMSRGKRIQFKDWVNQ
nr:hypothetical protein [uncultured Carboxylicivirga sp.]